MDFFKGFFLWMLTSEKNFLVKSFYKETIKEVLMNPAKDTWVPTEGGCSAQAAAKVGEFTINQLVRKG